MEFVFVCCWFDEMLIIVFGVCFFGIFIGLDWLVVLIMIGVCEEIRLLDGVCEFGLVFFFGVWLLFVEGFLCCFFLFCFFVIVLRSFFLFWKWMVFLVNILLILICILCYLLILIILRLYKSCRFICDLYNYMFLFFFLIWFSYLR